MMRGIIRWCVFVVVVVSLPNFIKLFRNKLQQQNSMLACLLLFLL